MRPSRKRGALLALYAFNAEIAAIRDRIREPLPGEIRLQWWRDVLERRARRGARPSDRRGAARRDRALRPAAEAFHELSRCPHLRSLRRSDADAHRPRRLLRRDRLRADPACRAHPRSGPRPATPSWPATAACAQASPACCVCCRCTARAANAMCRATFWRRPATIAGGVSRRRRRRARLPRRRAMAALARRASRGLRARRAGLAPALRPAFLPLALDRELSGQTERQRPAIVLRHAPIDRRHGASNG